MTNCYTYCKYDGLSRYTAFDLNEGCPVNRLIYCTLLEDNTDNRAKLQRLADMNKHINLKIQLRTGNGRVTFETK